ncbi:MAG: glycosyltransferase family 87 protein [Planctomycetia bacterium]
MVADPTDDAAATAPPTPPAWGVVGVWLAVLFLFVFYAGSASQTIGHQGADFYTHWTLARLAAEGRGARMYEPAVQRELADAWLPEEQAQKFRKDFYDRVGISPYPPVMVLLYLPFGWLTPRDAQTTSALLNLLFGVAAAAAAARLTALPVRYCLLGVLAFPGFFASFALGQNAATTLFLLTAGCLLLHRGRDAAAGISWALLSYKTPWVLAAGWTAVALRRPRCVLALVGGAAALAAAATAVFGVESWGNWLVRLRAIAEFYADEASKDEPMKQLGMATDLRGAAFLLFPLGVAKAVGTAALVAVVGVSAGLWWWADGRRKSVGGAPALGSHPAAGALLAGTVLASPYMMYYDATAFLLPLALLWRPRERSTAGFVALMAGTIAFYAAIVVMHAWPTEWGGDFRSPPFATLAMLFLWGLAGMQTVADVTKTIKPAKGA